MNLSEFVELSLILTGILSLPILAYNIDASHGDYSPYVFNTTSSFHSLETFQGESGFEYKYETEHGEISLKIGEGKIEAMLSKIGEVTKLEINYTAEKVEFLSPGVYFVKIRTPEKIYSLLRIPGNEVEVVVTPYGNETKIKGSGDSKRARKEFERVENKINENIDILKNFIEDITGERKVEITYLKCSGSDEEFVEITNNRVIDVSLDGWKIKDVNGTIREYDLHGILKAGKSIRLYRNETGITWNDSGDEAILIDKDGEIVSRRLCDE